MIFFFFNWEHHILLLGENIARYSKKKKKRKKKLQFEESEQISKPYKPGMLGVTDKELRKVFLIF